MGEDSIFLIGKPADPETELGKENATERRKTAQNKTLATEYGVNAADCVDSLEAEYAKKRRISDKRQNLIMDKEETSDPVLLQAKKNGETKMGLQKEQPTESYPRDFSFTLPDDIFNDTGAYLVIRPWSSDFNPEKASKSVLPIWIEFPALPTVFQFHVDKIVAQLGEVLSIDPMQGFMVRPSRRVCVELDLSKDLPEFITLTADGHTFQQKILYLSLPNTCFYCHEKGHRVVSCPKLLARKDSVKVTKFNETSNSPVEVSPSSVSPPTVVQAAPIQKDIQAEEDQNDGWMQVVNKKKSFSNAVKFGQQSPQKNKSLLPLGKRSNQLPF